jgi:hypothetical protein
MDPGENADDAPVGNELAPTGALAQAQENELARVTLYRCLRTLVRMLNARGYEITTVGTDEVDGSKGALHAIEQYLDVSRANLAEQSHEIVMEGEVVSHCKYTTAWACDIPIGSRIVVIVLDQGNVETMREINDALITMGIDGAILISRAMLTSYSKKFLVDKEVVKGIIQHFKYEELQAAIIDHSMVQRHMPLNKVMADNVRRRFKGAIFPSLQQADPMVRFLGLRPSMIVRVPEMYGKDQPSDTYFEVEL